METANPMEEIRERIANIQQTPLTSHVGEYEEIHKALEQALTSVEGL